MPTVSRMLHMAFRGHIHGAYPCHIIAFLFRARQLRANNLNLSLVNEAYARTHFRYQLAAYTSIITF